MRVSMRRFVGLCVMLGGCAGGGGMPSSPPTTTSIGQALTTAQFTITIPPKAAQAVSRSPKYISASTQSVVITLTSVGGKAYTGTASAPASIATNLTPSSTNCAPSGGNLVCTATATAVVGSDLYTVTTYDATQSSTSPATPAGNALSQGSTTLAIVGGQTNTGSLVLNGVVASVVVRFASNAHVSGSQAAGFTIVGNQPRTFTVSAEDADGNTIVGPGAPTFTLTSGSSAVTVASTAISGTYTAQVQSYSATPVQLTATPSNGSAVDVNVSTVQELWVGNSGGNSVTAYNASTGAQINGDTITGLSSPFMIQTGPNGDLWISNYSTNAIEEVVPETNAALLTIAGSNTTIHGPFGISFDSGGNLYLSNAAGNDLLQFTASSFAGLSGTQNIAPAETSLAITNMDPIQSAFDASGILWVSDNANAAVDAFNSGLTLVAQIAGSNTNLDHPDGVAFDSAGHLWVTNGLADSLAALNEYSTSGVTLTRNNISQLATIAGTPSGLNQPFGIAFDGSGNLWVANSDVSSSVTEYAAGSIGAGGNLAPMTTITAGINQAAGLTFTP
jgi:hypothetical protein